MGGADDPEVTAATAVEPRTARVRAPDDDPAIPSRLGHFQLLERIGRGGMGTVYSAFDLRLDRKVAIKVLAKDDGSPEKDHQRQQRLLREAQAMAKLTHPNVVPVYEVGLDGDSLYLAMEHVPGHTLGGWLVAEKRSWREIVGVFVQAARGLAAAHDVGIVHRDFKPANVLVDDKGAVRVVDFGIAQVRGTAEMEAVPEPSGRKVDFGSGDGLTPPSSSVALTELGSRVGTPAYMSPEQYRAAPVDARSDQFSFCVALYEALFGKRPFTGQGEKLADNIQRGVVEKPDPARAPGWVTAIVLRGLSTDPDQRFASMTALAEALAHDPGRRRRQIAVTALAAVALAAIATLVGWRLYAADETCGGAEARLAGVWDDATRAAVTKRFAATAAPYAEASAARVVRALDGYGTAWVAMRTDACKATRVRGEQSEHVLDLRVACLEHHRGELRALVELFAGPIDAAVVEHADAAATALPPLGACADVAALLQPGAEPTDAAARQRRAELRERLGRLNAERRVSRYHTALEPARALVADARAAGDARVLAEALELLGDLERNTDQLAAAEATLGEAVRRARQLGDIDLLINAGLDLVSTMAASGISKSREALGIIRFLEMLVADAHDPALPVRLALEKASGLLIVARHDLALPILEAALERARPTLGDDHGLTFQLQGLHAVALAHLDRNAEAIAEYDALIAAVSAALGPTHPNAVAAKVERCSSLFDSAIVPSSSKLDPDGFRRSAECYEQVLPEAEGMRPGPDRELINHRGNHAMAVASLGDRARARTIYLAAYADVPAEAWAEKWFISSDLARALGELELVLGEHAAALEHCERAGASTEGRHGTVVIATCIGMARLGLGQADAALAGLEAIAAEVASIGASGLGVDASAIGRWRFAYARALWAAKRQASRARTLAAEARTELGPGEDRAELDAWLANLPR